MSALAVVALAVAACVGALAPAVIWYLATVPARPDRLHTHLQHHPPRYGGEVGP